MLGPRGEGSACGTSPPSHLNPQFISPSLALPPRHARLYLANASSVMLSYAGTKAARTVVINE